MEGLGEGLRRAAGGGEERDLSGNKGGGDRATAGRARHGAPERADRYLSSVTRFRTLDVECESVAVRDDLAAAVDFLRDVE